MKWVVPSLSMLVLSVVGCSLPANYSAIYQGHKLSDENTAQTTLIDAKQRALFTVPGGFEEYEQERQYVICAEPSPDTVSSLSSAFSAGLGGGLFGIDSDSVNLAIALSEAAGQLGERNATIQLLRDSLYRQCEAYMNGMITGDEYRKISHRYVDAMVTLLAIEQVTSPNSGNRQLVLPSGDATAQVSVDSGEQPGAASDEASQVENTDAAAGDQGAQGDQGAVGDQSAQGAQDNQNDTAGTPSRLGGGVEARATSGRPEASQPGVIVSSIDEAVAKEVTEMIRIFLAKDLRDDCLEGITGILGVGGLSPARTDYRGEGAIRAYLDICREIFSNNDAETGTSASSAEVANASSGSTEIVSDTIAQ